MSREFFVANKFEYFTNFVDISLCENGFLSPISKVFSRLDILQILISIFFFNIVLLYFISFLFCLFKRCTFKNSNIITKSILYSYIMHEFQFVTMFYSPQQTNILSCPWIDNDSYFQFLANFYMGLKCDCVLKVMISTYVTNCQYVNIFSIWN